MIPPTLTRLDKLDLTGMRWQRPSFAVKFCCRVALVEL